VLCGDPEAVSRAVVGARRTVPAMLPLGDYPVPGGTACELVRAATSPRTLWRCPQIAVLTPELVLLCGSRDDAGVGPLIRPLMSSGFGWRGLRPLDLGAYLLVSLVESMSCQLKDFVGGGRLSRVCYGAFLSGLDQDDCRDYSDER